MPHYSTNLDSAASVDELFTFFSKPANLATLAPPELHLELLEGPPQLQLGSRLVWKGRRWGFSQKFIQEVTAFEPAQLFVVEQKQGPFARWVHEHHFAVSAVGVGTQVREEIEFEPPGGILGRLITADFIRKDLDKLFAFRQARLKNLFG